VDRRRGRANAGFQVCLSVIGEGKGTCFIDLADKVGGSVLLDGNDSPWYGFFFIQGLVEKLFQTPIGALAELSQEFLIE